MKVWCQIWLLIIFHSCCFLSYISWHLVLFFHYYCSQKKWNLSAIPLRNHLEIEIDFQDFVRSFKRSAETYDALTKFLTLTSCIVNNESVRHRSQHNPLPHSKRNNKQFTIWDFDASSLFSAWKIIMNYPYRKHTDLISV